SDEEFVDNSEAPSNVSVNVSTAVPFTVISNTLVSVSSPFTNVAVKVTTTSVSPLVILPSKAITASFEVAQVIVDPFAPVAGNTKSTVVVAGNVNSALSNANSSASVNTGVAPSEA